MRRLLGIVGHPLTGVGYVRFAQPFRHLRGLGFELVTLGEQLTLERGPRGYRPTTSLLDGIDAVLFPQLVASPTLADGSRVDLVGPICDAAAARGLPIIYSVDDYLYGIDDHNPAFERVSGSIENLDTILDRANAIFVATPALGRTLSTHGRPIHVLPNAVEPERWTPRPCSSAELRVGWAGSASHLADLHMVLPAIRKLQQTVDCRFVLLGLVDRPIVEEAAAVRRALPALRGSRRNRAEVFLELAGMLAELRHVHVPFVRMESYFGTLPALDLDIGICPLVDTEFNRHKSALKFYEYAMCETLTVASAVPPYLDEVSLTVPNDRDEWCTALAAWLSNPEWRARELARQREFVLAERTIERLRKNWAEALHETLGPGRSATPVTAAAMRRQAT